MDIKIKICCIKSPAEAQLAITAGANAIGLVSAMPSGPGVISELEIAAITSVIPMENDTFLLTSKQNVEELVAQHQRCGTTAIQLCDSLQSRDLEKLKQQLPNVNLVQVLHVTGPEVFDQASELEPFIDAFLLDSGNPAAELKSLGGTGRTHNWQISRAICQAVKVPVYLAGGLNSDNVAEAIATVDPYGIDVCSGVRINDRLDKDKLVAFIQAVKIANQINLQG